MGLQRVGVPSVDLAWNYTVVGLRFARLFRRTSPVFEFAAASGSVFRATSALPFRASSVVGAVRNLHEYQFDTATNLSPFGDLFLYSTQLPAILVRLISTKVLVLSSEKRAL